MRMLSTRSRLPPLASLLAFEAAARHLSFTVAARELNVTQGAVSRQILGLEAFLGGRLFHRRHRSLALTPEGEKLQAAVTLAFGHLVQTVSEIQRAPQRPPVTLATTTAFASLWVMPRVPLFYEAHPSVELRLVAVDDEPNFARDNIDLAVLYGKGDWPNCTATPLLEEEVFPVCSPRYLERVKPPTRPSDLASHALLHWEGLHRHWITWRDWFRGFHLPIERLSSAGTFSSYTLLLQAAIGGGGIALGWRHLVDEHLASGQLVRPLNDALRSGRAYYLAIPKDREPSAGVKLLSEWITAEAELSRAGEPAARAMHTFPPDSRLHVRRLAPDHEAPAPVNGVPARE